MMNDHIITLDEFKGLMAPFVNENLFNNQKFAVAVSGGADSMALTFLAHEWAQENNFSMTALTVNHNLRKESLEEALKVQEILKKHNIAHHILNWTPPLKKTKIQEQARGGRYNLLGQWCLENDVKNILLAHHKHDQVETFFSRLKKGSGLKGLSCMQPVHSWQWGRVIRPLLAISPHRLKSTLVSKNIPWIEDPSNQNDKFERVKIRKAMGVLNELGFECDDIFSSIMKLNQANQFIEKEIEAHSIPFLLTEFQKWHPYLQKRFLQNHLYLIGRKSYPPPDQALNALCEKLMQNSFKSATLGGCLIQRRKGGIIFITPETRKG